jgi:hypothetical protein
VLAALVPLWSSALRVESRAPMASVNFPTEFAGRSLTRLELTERERRFGAEFPGETRRFTDGEREIIIRFVAEATRKLHPATDCFQGVGYDVRPLPMQVDEGGARWSCFAATRGEERLRVCERIYDEAGESWTDVSAWYWSAVMSTRTRAPWWAITVAERGTMNAE